MLVDLARNDVGRVAVPGSVTVPALHSIERYSHVMHIVSEVEGRLRPDRDAFDAVRAVFPAGTLSGAPKVRAMQAIAALEGERRGPYGGAVGFLAPDDVEVAITIRSMVLVDGVAHVQAGAGHRGRLRARARIGGGGRQGRRHPGRPRRRRGQRRPRPSARRLGRVSRR